MAAVTVGLDWDSEFRSDLLEQAMGLRPEEVMNLAGETLAEEVQIQSQAVEILALKPELRTQAVEILTTDLLVG